MSHHMSQSMSLSLESDDDDSQNEHDDDHEVAEEVDWEEELALQAEAEALEERFDSVSADLKSQFQEILKVQAISRRIFTYKLLDSVQWGEQVCWDALNVLSRTPPDRFNDMADILASFRPEIMTLFLQLWAAMHYDCIDEVLNHLPLHELHRMMEILRHQDNNPEKREGIGMLDRIANYMQELSAQECLAILDHCNEPFAKNCRLCQKRRTYELQFRMNQQQIPDGTPQVPFLLADYHQPEVWQANDESGFTFDMDSGIVLWRGMIVDTLRICDKCINDVHKATVSDTRFDAYHHLDGSIRKGVLKALKEREMDRACMVGRLAVEMSRRRVRGWSLIALERQRHGITQERIKEEDDARRALRASQEAEAARLKKEMMDHAASVDDKWVAEDLHATSLVGNRMITNAELQYMHLYDKNNPVSTEREHPLSWRLKDVTAEGVPLSFERAKHRFGDELASREEWTGVEVHQDKLQEWEKVGREGHERHLDRLAEAARLKREEELRVFKTQQDYVDERLKELRRAKQLSDREKERLEELRLEKRAADRLIRRAARIAANEAAERELMAPHDEHGRLYRDERLDVIKRNKEAIGMRRCEIEQTLTDKFWGLPTLEYLQLLEAEKKRIEYEKNVHFMHGLMMKAEIVVPASAEEAAELKRLKERDKWGGSMKFSEDDKDQGSGHGNGHGGTGTGGTKKL